MNENPDADCSDADFDRLLAQCIVTLEAGGSLQWEQLQADHPQSVARLREFFHNHERLEKTFSPTGSRSLSAAELEPTIDSRANAPLAASFTLTEDTRRIGHYELLDEIDRGGMGIVFRARHDQLHRTVALKLIKSGQLASREEVERFRAEGRAAAQLDHPGIVSIFEVGDIAGLHYLAMALIDGQSLADLVAEQPLPAREAARLVMKIAQAVDYAHRRGIVHRDLKPTNVLVDSDGEPRVLDFGLAKNLRSDARLTQTRQIVGTPAFMAPEQARPQQVAITASVDIYALGAILYFLCTGQAPHQSTNPMDVILRVLEAEPVSPASLNPEVTHDLQTICLKCLEKSPQSRYPTAGALAEDLERFLKREPVEASRFVLIRELRRWIQREPALAAHWVIIAVALALIGLTYLVLGREPVYPLRYVVPLIGWGAACWGLQLMVRRRCWLGATRLCWATLDVIVLTLMLWLAEPPRGALALAYAVLIVASGTFLRVRFVVTTTGLVLLAYAGLILLEAAGLGGWYHLHQPAERDFSAVPAYIPVVVGALLMVGGLVAVQVHRLQSLSRYYEQSE